VNRAQRIRLTAWAIVITFLAGAIALAIPRGGEGQITITAYFTKAIGLFKDSHVRVLGVDVGRVTSVEAEGPKVKVVMTVDAARKIPADARAVVVPISLIADRYVQLTPVYSSGPVLKDGAVIDTQRTAIPAELDDLLSQLKKLLDAVRAGTLAHPESIGAAVRNLAAALQGAGDDLSATLGGGGALSGAITENAPAIEASVTRLADLLSAIAARRDDIAGLNANLAQALGAIASEHSTLSSALGNIALLTEQLGTLVKEHRPELESDISILAKTSNVLTRHQDSLITSLDWLHVLADGAEGDHNGGAIHQYGNGPFHIDVRDAHLFACPPGVPPSICLLLGLSGVPLSLSAKTPGQAGAPSGATSVGTTPPSAVAGPDPTNLLDLLPKLPLAGSSQTTSEGTPSLRDVFDGLGGLLDRALGWLM
jgi:phospholipid/cholesterol/gamma-HCH transport system substrate-binding protein